MFTSTSVGRALAAAAAAAAVAGCGSGGSQPTPSYPTPSYPTPSYPTPSYPAPSYPGRTDPEPGRSPVARIPDPPSPAARPAAPRGQVPAQVIGRWSGGVGDRTGEYLVIAADGSYARGKNGLSPYRAGIIVSRGTNFATYDTDGGRRAGQWEYTNAAGIEVLSVTFDGDYYSYSR